MTMNFVSCFWEVLDKETMLCIQYRGDNNTSNSQFSQFLANEIYTQEDNVSAMT